MVFMDKLYKESGNRCHFTASNADDKPLIGLVWSFTKHWRFTQAVNHRLGLSTILLCYTNRFLIVNHCAILYYRLKWLAEFGLVGYWISRTQPKLDQCQLDNYEKAASEKRVLTLKDLTGPFYFF